MPTNEPMIAQLSHNYWPWWLGGAALAGVAILFPWLVGAPLGVSGALARLLSFGGEKQGPTPAETGCGGTGPAAVDGSQRVANLLFLLAVVAGGAAAGWVGGAPWGRTTVSPEFHRLFGHGARALGVLFGGGLLVGLGTRWSGGCTSGHGLSGCGRLQPASLLATATFFGVAIGVSFLLERVLS